MQSGLEIAASRTGSYGDILRSARYAALQLWEDRHRGLKRAGRPLRNRRISGGQSTAAYRPFVLFPIVRVIALLTLIVDSRP